MSAAEDDTWEIDASFLPRLEEKIADLNRRIARLGVGEPLSYERLSEGRRKVVAPSGSTYQVATVTVRLTGRAPKIEGYRLLSRIDHLGTTNILSTAPGLTRDEETVVERYRHAPADCEHCRTDRRRRDTYVIVDAGGKALQVGRDCLQDFLRSDSAADAVRLFAMYEDLEKACDGWEAESAGESHPHPDALLVDTQRFLEAALAMTIVQGAFISKQVAESTHQESTAEALKAYFFSKSMVGDRYRNAVQREMARHPRIPEQAAELRRVVLGLAADSTYLSNVQALFSAEDIPMSQFGMAASGISVAQRHQEEQARAARAAALGVTSPFLGERGETIRTALQLLRKSPYDSPYGSGIIYVFRDAFDRRATWATTSTPTYSAQGVSDLKPMPGDVFLIAGKVAEQRTFRGENETRLTRVALIELLEDLPPPGTTFEPPAKPKRAPRKRLAKNGEWATEEDYRAACSGNGRPDADEFAAWGLSLPGAPRGSVEVWSYLLELLEEQEEEQELHDY